MKVLDTANTEEISKGIATEVVTGVTTNPTIISRKNKPFSKCIKDILCAGNWCNHCYTNK